MAEIEIVKRTRAYFRCRRCGYLWEPLRPRPKGCPNPKCQVRFVYPDNWEAQLRDAGFPFVVVVPTSEDAANKEVREA